MAIEIMKDSKVVQILIAQARKERVESADTANAVK